MDDVLAYCEEQDYVVEKICLYHLSKEAREETLAFCKNFDASLVFAEETSLELTHPLADKGLGLKWLSDYLGLSLSECIAVGDSFNDESILKVAGLSVSMGNGKSEIKSLCDEIVCDNDHGGVAMAIHKFLLGRS